MLVVVDLLYGCLAALALSIILHYCYRLIKSEWPASYQSLFESTTYRKALRPVRYVVFRSTPIILSAIFGTVQLERYEKPVWLFGILLWIFHTLDTNGRALLELRDQYDDNVTKRPRQALYVLMIVGTLILIQVSVLVALYVSRNTDVLDVLIPDIADIIVDMWVGIIGIILFFMFLQLINIDRSYEGAINRIRKQIDSHFMRYVRSTVTDTGFDFRLFEAVLIAESLQRPRWFRILERLKGLVWKSGTYGVMQVRSDRPLSDRESIDKALSEYGNLFINVSDRHDDGWYSDVVTRLRIYNGSEAFIQTVMDAYDELP